MIKMLNAMIAAWLNVYPTYSTTLQNSFHNKNTTPMHLKIQFILCGIFLFFKKQDFIVSMYT
jgi:hypothetical protein